MHNKSVHRNRDFIVRSVQKEDWIKCGSKEWGTEESCRGCTQGWSYQCDECDFAAVKREELKSHVEAIHRDGDYQCDEYDFTGVKS